MYWVLMLSEQLVAYHCLLVTPLHSMCEQFLVKPYNLYLRSVFGDVAGSDITRGFLQTAEEEDEVTGFSNGDMGLQACALYDYQAGKLPKPCAILAVI
jgi:hypothetical protein